MGERALPSRLVSQRQSADAFQQVSPFPFQKARRPNGQKLTNRVVTILIQGLAIVHVAAGTNPQRG
jgi:hypothetical protein